jgi:hypothetical protein
MIQTLAEPASHCLLCITTMDTTVLALGWLSETFETAWNVLPLV